MIKLVKKDIEKIFLQADSYRVFLKATYDYLKKHQAAFSYGYIAKKAGFSSRSFVKDVIDGKKSLTAHSIKKVARGFGLTGDLADGFYHRVCLEEGDIDGRLISKERRIEKIFRIERKIKQSHQDKDFKASPKKPLFQNKHWQKVYAATGSHERGRSLERIVELTQLPMTKVSQTTDFLIEQDVVRKDPKTGYIVPQEEPNLFLDKMNESDIFCETYKSQLAETGKSLESNIKKKDCYFFSSYVSIDSNRKQEFVEELKNLVFEFVEDIEKAEGDSIAKVLLSFE